MSTCPTCHQETHEECNVLKVTPATVVDIVDVWMVGSHGRRTRKIPIVFVDSGATLPKQPLTEAKAEQP